MAGTGNYIVLGNTDIVTASGTGTTATIQGTGDVLTAQSARIGLLDKSSASVTGQGDTFGFFGGSTLAVSGTNEAFVFMANPGTSTISGWDASDSVQFSTSTFANWQALLGHASQSGANTLIQLDPTDTLTLTGVALTSLKSSQVHFM